MNRIEPSSRFSAEAVRKHEGGGVSGQPGQLNETARQVAAQYRRDTISPIMVSGVLRLVELALLVISGATLFVYYVGLGTELDWHYPAMISFASLLAVILLDVTDCYQLPALMRPLSNITRIATVWAGTLALFAVAGFFLKLADDFSRVWFGGWFVAGLVLLLGLRLLLAHTIKRWARNGTIERRAVIVGGGKAAETLIRSIEQQPYNDIRICGIFDDRDDRRSPALVAGYPKLGTVSELIEFARIARIDMLIVSLPLTAETRVLSLLKKLWVLPVDIRLSAHSNQLQFRPRSYSYIGSVPMLDIFDKPINDWDSVAKRAFDVVVQPGRHHLALAGDGRDCHRHQARQQGSGALQAEAPRLQQRDHRGLQVPLDVYRPGRSRPRSGRSPRAIRASPASAASSARPPSTSCRSSSTRCSARCPWSGPRPHAVAAQSHNLLYNEVVDGYFARHRVKPGVTGWAQINGWRGEMDTDEKIRMRTEYDLYYIENWSLWLDLEILFLTPVRLLNTENAY